MERRFRLQPILNLRANKLEMLQLELARLQAAEAAARGMLEELRGESDRTLSETGRLLAGGPVDVAAVEQGFVYAGAVQLAIGVQLGIVQTAADATEAKRAEVIRAMQDHKVLEKLKQRHDTAYGEWATRVEQVLVDDMVTVRYNRRAAAGEEAIS